MLVPNAVFDQHIIVLGKTRSGKSSVMRLLVEHLLKHEKPVCIVDPKGDWFGLKSSHDGKKAGYPVVIFGGEHADVPLNSRSGAAVAELVATGNRPSIIDLGGWMPGARTEFYIDFAAAFFIKTRGRRWLVIDEVHNFAPKGKIMDPQAGKMLHWSNRLASEGLGKGVALIAASQRPQKVHNDFLTSCETLIAMRVIHKSDRDAIEDWIEGCGDEEKGPEVVNTLAAMKRGEGWVWSPEAEFGPKRIQFPMFQTYDSFKARNSEESLKLRGWADVDLADVTKKLEAVVREAEAKDPTKLQARVRELERELAKSSMRKEGFLKPVVDSKAVERAVRPFRALLEEAMRLIVKVTAIGFEDTAIKPEEIKKALEATAKEISRITKAQMQQRNAEFERFKREANHLLAKMKNVMESEPLKVEFEIQHKQVMPVESLAPFAIQPSPPAPRMPREPRSVRSDTNGLPPGELLVLRAVAQYGDGVERDQLSVLSGYKKSSRDTYISKLKQRAYITEAGGRILATEEGIVALGDRHEPLPEGVELQEYWLGKLTGGERAVFEAILAHGGRAITKEKIDETTSYKKSSRDTYISKLIARRIVENAGRGEVKVSANLF